MRGYVIVTRSTSHGKPSLRAALWPVCLLIWWLAGATAHAQGAAETLPPAASFPALLARPLALRPELRGVHPRLFFTAGELVKLRAKAQTTERDLWQEIVREARAFKQDPPAPGDPQLDRSGVEQKPGDISQYTVALALAEASVIYAVAPQPHYLAAAKKWLLAACRYDPWGYSYRTPNVDLPPAYLLYGVALSYDTLYARLTDDERAFVRAKLIKQARLMYAYFQYKPKKQYSFSQNHTSLPLAGLALAAYVLMDEVPEAVQWAQLARAVFDRVLTTFSPDGYFYEGFHYFTFSFRWTLRYLDAHRQVTGEDLYPLVQSKFTPLKYYVLHSLLPDGKNVFDFGDTGDGASNRVDGRRTEKLYGDYEMLYRLASVYHDAEAQAVAERVRQTGHFPNREPVWAFLNHDATLAPAPLTNFSTSYYFTDNDTVFWRSDWTPQATALAFRCSPPEGHQAAQLLTQLPEWKQNTGHAHPDANSFIIYASGQYLTGDTGYTGQKQTDDHNTILVNGRGQERDGRHEVFKDVSPTRLNRLRLAEVWATPDYFYARGEAAAGYYSDLRLTQFDRQILYVAPDYFLIQDDLAAAAPARYTFLLNADRTITLTGDDRAELLNLTAGLRVERVAPGAARSSVVPQMVMARGRPGSIEDGTPEQRGVQVQTTTAETTAPVEFIHFLQPFAVGHKPTAPTLTRTADGLRIQWLDGAEDIVVLRPAARYILRRAPSGGWTRLILQNLGEVAPAGTLIVSATQPLAASLTQTLNGTLSGWVRAQAPTEVTLRVTRRPSLVRVNGHAGKFSFAAETKLLTLTLPAGNTRLEAD